MISIVIPIYNNKATLKVLHESLSDSLRLMAIPYEIIFVDDSCPEGSLDELKKIADGDMHVGVVSFEKNMGQHKAVLEGIRASHGDIVVTMDGDMQDSPKDIAVLVERLKAGDVSAVFAGRKGVYQSFFRMFCSRIYKALQSILCKVPKDAGLFLAINRRLANKVIEFRGDKPFLISIIGCLGVSTVSIPIVRDKRGVGTSSYSTWGRIKSGLRALRLVLLWKLTGGSFYINDKVEDGSVKSFYGKPFEGNDFTPKVKVI